MLIGLLFALAAMVFNSVAGLLESAATRLVSPRRSLVRQPRYLIGLAVDGLGWLCTVVALRWLPVFVVQAVLGGAIALTAVGTRVLYRTRWRRVDLLGCLACTAGLALVAASAAPEQPSAPGWPVILLLAAGAGLLGVALLALRSSARAWPLAVIAGLGFGGTSIAVRAVHLATGRGARFEIASLIGQPAVYLVLVFFALGMVAYSRALELTSVAQLTAVLLVTEVTVPGLVGIALLGDAVRSGWGWAMGSGLALAIAGVLALAGSPAQLPPPHRVVR